MDGLLASLIAPAQACRNTVIHPKRHRKHHYFICMCCYINATSSTDYADSEPPHTSSTGLQLLCEAQICHILYHAQTQVPDPLSKRRRHETTADNQGQATTCSDAVPRPAIQAMVAICFSINCLCRQVNQYRPSLQQLASHMACMINSL